MKNYDTEVQERWGYTQAYKEYAKKTEKYTESNWKEVTDGLNAIFVEFYECKDKGNSATSKEAQELVLKLQEYITANFYTCTDEILENLGQTYVSDEEFKKNIDKYGEGTAEFVAETIKFYLKK